MSKPVDEHTPYYRHLAETVVRSWYGHSTSPTDKMYIFLDFGLTYGPSDEWPKALIDAWAVGGMRGQDRTWPCHENMKRLVETCQDYLAATEGEDT